MLKITQKKPQISDGTPLSITFTSDTDESTKKEIRNSGFKWNKFRTEFYGHGNKSEIEPLLKNTDYKVEVIE